MNKGRPCHTWWTVSINKCDLSVIYKPNLCKGPFPGSLALCEPALCTTARREATYKMSKTPDLPNFSGEVPTPKGKAEFDNWMFQLKLLQKTYMDDAIRNAVVSYVRGIANTVVRAVGYDA